MLAAQMAADKVIELASKTGFAIVALNNIFKSTGAIGYYARKIAQRDLGQQFAQSCFAVWRH
jgi:LDH2 family malate/lactate/ureidoglycolate dehydrogenase